MATRKRIEERTIVQAVIRYLKKSGVNKIFTEAQFCNRFIDVLWIDEKNEKLVAIEAKINSPAKAFKQAMDYKYLADYVYVAVLKNSTNRTAIDLAKKTGIGLIFIGENSEAEMTVDLFCHPSASECKNSNMADYVIGLNSNMEISM